MITLNLISQELKKEIKLKRIYFLLRNMNYTILVIILSAAILLLLAKMFLQNNFNNVIEQTTLVTKNVQTYNSKVKEINEKISAVAAMQSEYLFWSKFFEELAAITPDGITYQFVKTDSRNQVFKIRGLALSRGQLIEFKNNLSASPLLRDIVFPIQNILTKENIDFEIEAKINLEKIKTI